MTIIWKANNMKYQYVKNDSNENNGNINEK